jgi:hypothetical protein
MRFDQLTRVWDCVGYSAAATAGARWDCFVVIDDNGSAAEVNILQVL